MALPPRLPASREEGLTLVESLIVLLVISILVAIAVPQYVSMAEGARDAQAKTELRALALVAEVYFQDNTGQPGDADGKAATSGYQGMTTKLLRKAYNPSLSTALGFSGKPKAGSYCARIRVGATWWSAAGPGMSGSFKQNKKCT